jgi:hypothetical protein
MAKTKTDNKEDAPSPTPMDLSKEAIKKAHLKHLFSRWSLRYPLVGALLSTMGGALFGFNPVFITLIALSCGTSGFSWLYNYVINSGRFERNYIEKIKAIKAQQIEDRHQMVARELKEFDCDQGHAQLDLFRAKFDTFVDILGGKLNPSEITHARYYNVAQEVFLRGMDNLLDIVNAFKSIQESRPEADQQRLKTLKNANNLSEDQQEEVKALERRLVLYDEQKERINHLLSENETALTALDETMVALSKIETSTESKMEMEDAMKELIEMAKRASLYSNTGSA